MKNNKKAFTLIELLVVVLIIGILSAVALPQYQKAVEKAKAAQALTLLRSVVDATKAYHLANGTYPSKFEELDIQVPFTDNSHSFRDLSIDHTDWKSNEEWVIGIYKYPPLGDAINIVKKTGKYKGALFVYSFNRKDGKIPLNQLVCNEASELGFSQKAGSYCQNIFNGTLYADGGNFRAYSLP